MIFHGGAVPDRRPLRNGGHDLWDGCIAVSQADSSLIEPLLPRGYELAQPRNGTHPIVMMIGNHRKLNVALGGWKMKVWPIICNSYYELIVLAPFVTRRGDVAWHNYVIGMVLDHPLAIGVGNKLFGYRKQFGRFNSGGMQINARTPIFDARAYLDQPDARVWRQISQIFTAPILSDGLGYPIGHYWSLDARQAHMTPTLLDYKFINLQRATFGAAQGRGVVIKGLRWQLNSDDVIGGRPWWHAL